MSEKELNIQLDLYKQMNELAGLLDNYFKPYGFALLVFPRDTDDGRMNYISNSNRSDMLVAMQEFIDKQKAANPIDNNTKPKGK